MERTLFVFVSSEKKFENWGGFDEKIVRIFALNNIVAPTLQYYLHSI